MNANKKKTLKVLLLTAVVLFILFLLLLPTLVKAYLINTLNEMGLKNPQFTIRHVGINQLDIQHFSVGNEGEPGNPV